MIEQTTYKRMADLAEQYPAANKQTYRDAVKKFRLPYWDYYRPRGKAVTFPGVVNKGTTTANYDFSVPQIFTVAKVMLKTPAKNQLESKDNPLHLFNFPKTGGIPANQWTIISSSFSHTQTQRYPGASNTLTALNDAVNKAREPSTKLILNMMSDAVYDQYDAFAYQHSSPGPSGSLESSK
jgi:tyrosinase